MNKWEGKLEISKNKKKIYQKRSMGIKRSSKQPNHKLSEKDSCTTFRSFFSKQTQSLVV